MGGKISNRCVKIIFNYVTGARALYRRDELQSDDAVYANARRDKDGDV